MVSFEHLANLEVLSLQLKINLQNSEKNLNFAFTKIK